MNLEQEALDKKNEYERVKKDREDVQARVNQRADDLAKFEEALADAIAAKEDASAYGYGPEEWEKVNWDYEMAK